eukprot:g11000.t2
MLDKSFREEYVQTFGFDISVVPYGTYQGRPVKLHLWDVAGSQLHAQPCHHPLIGQGAVGVMYVMDVTSRESLQAIDDWDQALSEFLPAWTCKLLVGHKADLPAYVVNDEALSLYVAGANGFKGWCLTVGSSEYGDYDVAARRGAGGATGNAGGRYKGQSLSGEKQLSVSEAVRTLLGHVFRAGGVGEAAVRPAGVLGLGASAGRATPLPSENLGDALQTVELLGLGVHPETSNSSREDELAAVAGRPEGVERSGDRPGDNFAKGMETLLERGSGPDLSWSRRGPREGGSSARVGGGGAGVDDGDLGWRCFAGRMGREEAEALLRGRPDGTFFVRRKGPSLLVLSYVALSRRANSNANTPSSGGKHRHKGSPSTRLSSPSPPTSRMRDAFGSPLGGNKSGRRATIGPAKDFLADNTTVQHALLVYEGGFFSDEKGRLGKFHTIQELLKSKISALARYPLNFRRERDGYVLTDNGDSSPTTPPLDAELPSEASTPSISSNPFARADGDNAANDVPVRGSTATSLAPTVTGDLFGATNPRGVTARPRAASARTSPSSSPPTPASPLSTSPSVDRTDTGNPLDIALRGQRSTGTVSGAPRRVGSDWIDSRRHSSSKARRRGEGPRDLVSSSAGGGWLEAAAAAEKASTTAAAGGAGVNNASGRPRGGSLSSAASRVVTASSFHATAGRRTSAESGSRRESVSSADSAGSPASARAVDILDSKVQQRQHQQRWRGGVGGGTSPSGMEAAAEAAAAKASARDHPNARRVEDQALAVQVMTERALAILEHKLGTLITRTASERSPRYSPRLFPTSPSSLADTRGVRRVSLSSPLSALSGPDFYAKPPESGPPQVSDIQQQHRWVAAVPEGSITAPLVAAAILLMERAWLSRQSLIDLVQNVRERAVALAVEEASAAGGIPAVAGGDGLSRADVAAAGAVPINGNGSSRSPLTSPPSSPSPAGMTEGQRFSLPATDARGLTGRRGTNTAPPPAHGVGMALSCCADFERILGETNDDLPQEEISPLVGDDGAAAIGNSVLPARDFSDKGKRLSDSSVIAERSFCGIDQPSGGGGALNFTGGINVPTLRPSADTWPAVFEAVATAEEQGREVVGIWETAGGALKDACDELAFEGADRSMAGGANCPRSPSARVQQ